MMSETLPAGCWNTALQWRKRSSRNLIERRPRIGDALAVAPASTFNLRVAELGLAPPGVHILADYVFGNSDELKGIFIYEKAGILSGVEVVGYGGDALSTLPNIADLRPVCSRTCE
jgi:hypothetical protein